MNKKWLTTATLMVSLPLMVGGDTQESSPTRTEKAALAEAVWQGRVTSTLDYGDYQEVLTGGVKFEYASTNGSEDTYKITGGSVTWSAAGKSSDCVYSGGPTVYALSETNTDSEMIIFSNGRYAFGGSLTAYPPGIIKAVCDPGGSFDVPGQNVIFAEAPLMAPYYHLGDAGTTMKGSYSLGFAEWTWDLTSKPPELEIEIAGYDSWTPEAGADEKDPGKDLSIVARLIKEDGSPLGSPADTYRFELIKASKEPGIAMNYPWPELATDDYDLQFLKERNPDAEKNDEANGQWIEMPNAIESNVTLTSFDWGAFGTMKVTANVDGVELVGHLKGDKDTREFLVPKRKNESKIADAWKAKNNATSLADDDDTDNKPEGDGDTGDGFTLYEEYRGFMENGKHINGKPIEKDFFIFDDLGGRSKQGIGLFISATKLNVHHELTDNEFPSNRVINVNHNEAPRKGDQHGVWIVRGDAGYTSRAVGGPGLPKQISRIEMGHGVLDSPDAMISIRSGGNTVRVDRYAEVFTHELGHTVNIWHHGEEDAIVTWEIKRNADGSMVRDTSNVVTLLENGSLEFILVREPSVSIVPLWLQRKIKHEKIWVGWAGGQHSGDEQCFMSYSIANAYGWYENQRFLIRSPGQYFAFPPANRFCTSPVGTGRNAPDREPHPQFYDASGSAATGPAKRGNCLGRICVNDSKPVH